MARAMLTEAIEKSQAERNWWRIDGLLCGYFHWHSVNENVIRT